MYGDPMTTMRREREAREAAEAAAAEQARAENAAAHQRLATERAQAQRVQQAQTEAALEAELAAERQHLEREWVAHHPGRTATDFRAHAWPQLRANLVERRRHEAIERTKAELLQSGMVRF